jgi:hypothetical protein
VVLVALCAVLAAAAVGAARGSEVVAARTCADYQNQREAQLHKDTADPDGDGIYCESLPCPCLRPGSTGGGGPALFKGRCKRGRLPDRRCTPGAVFKRATAARICRPGYSGRARNVSESRKQRVYLAYGIRRHRPGEYEIDHLISLELGGSNSLRNLWPERQPGARAKDVVENALHAAVCDGTIALRKAQREIAHWTAAR